MHAYTFLFLIFYHCTLFAPDSKVCDITLPVISSPLYKSNKRILKTMVELIKGEYIYLFIL